MAACIIGGPQKIKVIRRKKYFGSQFEFVKQKLSFAPWLVAPRWYECSACVVLVVATDVAPNNSDLELPQGLRNNLLGEFS